MLLYVLNILFVLVAISMVALILLQRGSGRQPAPAPAAVLGHGVRARGRLPEQGDEVAGDRLLHHTLAMAWYATRHRQVQQQDMGIMGSIGRAQAPEGASAVPRCRSAGPGPGTPASRGTRRDAAETVRGAAPGRHGVAAMRPGGGIGRRTLEVVATSRRSILLGTNIAAAMRGNATAVFPMGARRDCFKRSPRSIEPGPAVYASVFLALRSEKGARRKAPSNAMRPEENNALAEYLPTLLFP